MILPTYRQLIELGIHFGNSSCIPHPYFTHELYHHYHGIVFCGSTSKGKILCQLLNDHEYVPEVIICVDDSRKHVEDIKRHVHEQHPAIEFIGIRYSAADHQYQLFDATAAHQELMLINQKIYGQA